MRLFTQNTNAISGTSPPIGIIEKLKITIAGESNAISANADTDQDFGAGGKQEDLPPDGVIQNAIHFSGLPPTNTWVDFRLDMNYSPNHPAWGIEYRVTKQALENDKVANTLELMKYAVGGSRIGEDGAWNIVDGSYQLGMRTITSIAGDFRPDFFIWIQGLNDAVSDSLADAYESNLRGWAADTITNINPKYIVIVRASTLTIPNYSHRVPTIQAAQDVVSAENSRYILANSTDINYDLNPDGIHYSPVGMDDLGTDIFNTIKPYINSLATIP